jgi:hypothetical protein
MLRQPVRELYRVYDEHVFLSGSAEDPDATQIVLRAGGHEHGFLAVLVPLLLAGVAGGALLTIEHQPFSAAPRAGAGRSLAARILAARPRAKSFRGRRQGSREAPEQPPRTSSHVRSVLPRERARSARAPSDSRAVTAVALAVVQSAGARPPAREFGFER